MCDRRRDLVARAGAIDFELADVEYFNPWRATRVVAVWFDLMLQESGGDLDRAVRSYHRGSPLASRGEGIPYLDNVKRLRRRYISNEDGSPAWQFLFAQVRQHEAVLALLRVTEGPGVIRRRQVGGKHVLQ